jgi:hypothetical protein
MNILLEKHNTNPDHIYFGETLQNSIIENGVFTRIIYSNSDIIMNGMQFYIEIPSNYIYRENNRIKIKKESDMLNFMFYVENLILQKISLNKIKNYKLKDYLKNGFIKYNSDIDSIKFILKISGVWETDTEYGLTFKITNVN